MLILCIFSRVVKWKKFFFSKIFQIVHNLIIKTEIHLIISNEFEMIIYFFVQSNLYFMNNGQKKISKNGI